MEWGIPEPFGSRAPDGLTVEFAEDFFNHGDTARQSRNQMKHQQQQLTRIYADSAMNADLQKIFRNPRKSAISALIRVVFWCSALFLLSR
jgi:hypothetical protein